MHMSASTKPPEAPATAKQQAVASKAGGTSTGPASSVTNAVGTTGTSNPTGETRWVNLKPGKPIPSPDDWRALEKRASSFRLR
jgi:hypothetical protein